MLALLDGPRRSWEDLELALRLIGQDQSGRRTLTEHGSQVQALRDGAAMDRHVRLVARQGPVAPPPARDGMLYDDAEALVRQLISRWLAG